LSTIVARLIVSQLRTARRLTRAVVAFAVYETALFTAAVGGTGAFTASIITRILAINAAALAGLGVLYRLGVAVGISQRPSRLPVVSS
jgi:hypothetical protein